jgi:hypothetical protein
MQVAVDQREQVVERISVTFAPSPKQAVTTHGKEMAMNATANAAERWRGT